MKQKILLNETKQNDLISAKQKKLCRALCYFEQILVFPSAVINCVSISAFASLFSVPAGIVSSAVGLKICAITAGIKTCESINQEKKKKKKHDKVCCYEKLNYMLSQILFLKP